MSFASRDSSRPKFRQSKGSDGHTWNACATAIMVAKKMQENGFSGYDQPAKLSKIKSRLSNVEYVALLPDDSVVASDKVNHRVQIFDADGAFCTTLTSRRVRPLGIATNRSGMVAYVDNCAAGTDKFINMVNAPAGQQFARWGEDMIWKPRAIALSNKGQLIITDMHRKQTQVGVYTVDGRCLRVFDPSCQGDIRPSTPYYVAVDPFDRILVSDRENHCVKVFDERGMFLSRIGSRESGDERLAFPRGVCCDSKGNVMVCDTGHSRLALFSADGQFQQNLLTSEDGLVCPRDVALNRTSGRLAVAQHSSSADSSFRKIRIYEIGKL